MERLEGVHPLLVDWAFELVTIMDNSVISGVRNLTEQRELVSKGMSKTMKSKHLIQQDGYGHALDLAPYPIKWERTRSFDLLAGVGLGLAAKMGIVIRWGGDWDRDMDVYDQNFNDLGHFEIHPG
jgi:peptidoglycan L-alanyl-D-glutamate endopeptidase CwlK